MPTASIITITTPVDLAGSLATRNVDWDVETQYLDADVSFFDIASPNLMTVPADPTIPTGTVYEAFLWLEDSTVDWGTGSGMYLGFYDAEGGYESWGIIRDLGYPSRGVRTGPIEHDGTAQNWSTAIREFQSESYTPAGRCRMGILVGNPVPIAVAAAIESGYSTGSTEKTMDLNEDFDKGGIYDPSTGVYTAPAGTELAVCNVNGYITSSLGRRLNFSLNKNGTEIARYEAQHSARGTGPGTFGLIPASSGDTFEFRISDDAGTRTGDFQHSVEFY